jgi:hypothetical protein
MQSIVEEIKPKWIVSRFHYGPTRAFFQAFLSTFSFEAVRSLVVQLTFYFIYKTLFEAVCLACLNV